MRPSPFFMNSTKRALALVAGASAVLAASTVGTSAKAQLTTLLQSGIQRPSAGVDIGTNTMAKGTITYSNSAGSSDNFSVGTQTSINANASASSTSDYQVTSTASFDMGNNASAGIGGGLSVISQQIGKSSSQSASQSLDIDTATSFSESASEAASQAVSKKYVEITDSTASEDRKGRENGYWWWANNRWNQFETSTENNVETTAQEKFESASSAEYNKQYDMAFSSSLSEKAASDGADGTISGEFVKNAGASSTSNYQSSQYRDAASGDIVDTSAFSFAESTATDASDSDFVATSTTDSNTTLNVVREQIQHSDFSQTAATTNTVTVKGINSSNSIVADDGAEFTSTISKIDTTTTGGDSGTASGSAAGAVATNASASATSSSFISSFVQAY